MFVKFSWKARLFVFLAVLVFMGLASYGSFPEMGRQLGSFPVTHLLAALALAALNLSLIHI